MVADTRDETLAELHPDFVETDPFPDILKNLQEINASLRGVIRDGEGMFRFEGSPAGGLPGAMQGGASYTKIRASTLVFSVTAAATVTLSIGSVRYTYVVPAGDTRIIPLALIIERAADVTLTTTAGVVTGHLLGTPE